MQHQPKLSVLQVCKFLIQLSMDFSSYYNRVHILGVSRMSQAIYWGLFLGASKMPALQQQDMKEGGYSNVKKQNHHLTAFLLAGAVPSPL